MLQRRRASRKEVRYRFPFISEHKLTDTNLVPIYDLTETNPKMQISDILGTITDRPERSVDVTSHSMVIVAYTVSKISGKIVFNPWWVGVLADAEV